MIILIAAVGKNGALGKDNELLWHLPDDFKRFKALTTGHPIIMGRKTFESLPGVLPGRKHIILTRQKDFVAPQNCVVVHDFTQAIKACSPDKDIYVIGGGQIYSIAMPYAQRLELTVVDQDFQADTFFPVFNDQQWDLLSSTFHEKDSKHNYDFSFLTYQRK